MYWNVLADVQHIPRRTHKISRVIVGRRNKGLGAEVEGDESP